MMAFIRQKVDTMHFSIIIPTCSRNEKLGLCFDRLVYGMQTLSAHHYEVIVCDDGPNDGVETFWRENFPFVSYTTWGTNRSSGQHQPWKPSCKGQLACFTDDHCLPDAVSLQAYAIGIRQYSECKALEGSFPFVHKNSR